MVIATRIVAVARVSPTDKDSVGSLLKRTDYKLRINPPGAGNSDYPYCCRVTHPAYAGQVGSGIGAPFAAKPDNIRLPISLGLVFY